MVRTNLLPLDSSEGNSTRSSGPTTKAPRAKTNDSATVRKAATSMNLNQ